MVGFYALKIRANTGNLLNIDLLKDILSKYGTIEKVDLFNNIRGYYYIVYYIDKFSVEKVDRSLNGTEVEPLGERLYISSYSPEQHYLSSFF